MATVKSVQIAADVYELLKARHRRKGIPIKRQIEDAVRKMLEPEQIAARNKLLEKSGREILA